MAVINLYPISTVVSTNTTANGAATHHECVDDVVADDALTYCRGTTGFDLRLGVQQMPPTSGIANVKLVYRCHTHGGTDYTGLTIAGDSTNKQANTNAAYTSYSMSWALNPVTGVAWVTEDFDPANLVIRHQDFAGATHDLTMANLEVTFSPLDQQVVSVIDAGSRALWHQRRSRIYLETAAPGPVGLDLGLLDFVPVTHLAGPHDSAVGWGAKNWQRRPHRVHRLTISPANDIVDLRMLDLRPYLCLLRDTAWTTRKSTALADGISRLSKPVTRTYTRESYLWFPSGASGRIQKTWAGYEAHAANGDIHEAGATNKFTYSSFGDGNITGWTKNGTGSNGSAIGVATEPLLFEEDVLSTDQCVKFTAGNPLHAASMDIHNTHYVWSFVPANTIVRLAFDTYDVDEDDPLWWLFRRTVAGTANYWDDTAESWGAGTVWNKMDGAVGWHQSLSKRIDVGGGLVTGMTVYIGQPNVGAYQATAGQINYLGHAQAQVDEPIIGSRIVTTNAIVAREASQLLITNDDGARSFSAAQGAFACQVIPFWDAADVGDDKTVFYVEHDADNWARLYYDGAGTQWVFEFRAIGTTYQATKSASPVRGTTYTLICRWTGANGELDETPYTISLFVDGVKGTDDVAEAMDEETDVDLEIGSTDGAEHFDGQIRLIHSYQWVPTDAECARLP